MPLLILCDLFNFPEADPKTWILVQIIHSWNNSENSCMWVGKCVREGKEWIKSMLSASFPQWATGTQSHLRSPGTAWNTWLRTILLEGRGSWGIHTPIPIWHWLRIALGRGGIDFLAFLACNVHIQRGLQRPERILRKRDKIFAARNQISPLKW